MSEKLDKFIEECTSKKFLEIYHFFTKEQIENIKKLGHKLENKKYTIYEFDILENDIIGFLNSKDQLEKIGISQEKFHEIIQVFKQISKEYNI